MPKPKPILKRKEKSGKLWKCCSVLHKQCARIVEQIIESDQTRSKGVTLKSLTLAKEIKSKKATHAVVCETLRFLPVIQDVLHRCGIEDCLKKCIGFGGIYVLIYELLFGQSFPLDGKAERKIHSYRELLKSSLEEHMKIKQIKDPMDLVTKRQPSRPLFARVNTLKITLNSTLKSCNDASPEVIEWLPDMLKFPPGTQLHDHDLVKNGSLFLQGFGSSLVAHALNPEPNWKVIDACSAPGHKTIHLASLLPPPGSILALDRNQSRLKRLNENISLSGATNIRSQKIDFLSVDPGHTEYRDVVGMILDPSCSGSGTTHTRMDELLPSSYGVSEDGISVKDEKRIQRLASFQIKMLRHGLSFPKLKRLVYSTCSIYEEENERVIQAVLEEAKQLKFKLKLVLPQWKRRGHPLFDGCETMIRIDPKEDATDGFFIAVFERHD